MTLDYFDLPGHGGGSMNGDEKHYHSDGTEHTIEHIPWKKLLKSVEEKIGRDIAEDRRLEVYDRVMQG